MTTYDTPEPISVEIDIPVGDIRLTASDRADTDVEVRPSDRSQEQDVRAAEQTLVDFAAGRLLVRGPRQRGLSLFGRPGSVDVTIALPAGSHLQATAAAGSLHATGRLGECRIKTSAGDVDLDQAGSLDLTTSAGDVAVARVTGDAEVSTGSGDVRLRAAGGTVSIKNSNGDSWVGEAGGDLRMSAANGDINVGSAGAGITATTAAGDVRIGAVTRGSVSLKTAFGDIEIGIRAGTAARLDTGTSFGRVRNEMTAAAGPEPSDQTADVRARTSYGDIVIRRAEVTA